MESISDRERLSKISKDNWIFYKNRYVKVPKVAGSKYQNLKIQNGEFPIADRNWIMIKYWPLSTDSFSM